MNAQPIAVTQSRSRRIKDEPATGVGYENCKITVELVTPALATGWLNTHNTGNRSLREGHVEQYASDMRNGRWTRCTAPICFYADGGLADGQHRLWAVVESATAQYFVIMRGLERPDGLNIDIGRVRTVVDNGIISGTSKELSTQLLSVARAVSLGTDGHERNDALSPAARILFLDAHREACKWVVAHGPHGRGLRNSVVMGAMARAWYWEAEKDRLARFAEVFTTGLTNQENEFAAIALRNYFLTNKGLLNNGLWRDSFLRSQNALAYFMRRRKVTSVRRVTDEAYPPWTPGATGGGKPASDRGRATSERE